jgi:hypothetical protein
MLPKCFSGLEMLIPGVPANNSGTQIMLNNNMIIINLFIDSPP